MRYLALAAIALSTRVAADIVPVATRDDPRVTSAAYKSDQTVQIATSPGSDLTILLGPSERISNIRLSDYARYQVTISQARDSLVLHTSAVTYQNSTSTGGTLQVSSDQHTYAFAIASAPAGQPTPYVLRFTYAHATHGGERSGDSESAQYRVSGNREVRPSSIRDDGTKTFIQWPADAALPAVFALEHGREEMVNGFVRNGVFTIDRVHKHLVFRIDKLQADAERRTTSAMP